MKRLLKCSYCEKEYTATSNASKFCSVRCRKKAAIPPKIYKRHLICTYCGVKFDAERRRRYCSEECRLCANGRTATVKKKNTQKPKLSLEQVAALSHAAGMSYGEFVLKNNL